MVAATLVAVLVAFMTAGACGSGRSVGGGDASVSPQSDANGVDSEARDTATGGEAATAVDSGSDDSATGDWPPPPPWHSGTTGATVACTLPPCDPSGDETIDLSGTWAETMTTASQNCNAIVAGADPRMATGHSETSMETYLRAGECVYKGSIGGTLVGVIKGHVMIYCELGAVDRNVTPVTEILQTFTDGSSAGQGWTYLFDVPLPPANCEITYTVSSQRQ